MRIYNIYVVGKNTPNKIKLFQIFARKEPDDKSSSENIEKKLEFIYKTAKYGGKKYIVFNLTEEEADSLQKDKDVDENYFYYVFDVDDSETFEKLQNIHPHLKEKFDGDRDRFVLYGINSNIKNERKVSFEELIAAADKNDIPCFELQEFNTEKIIQHIKIPVANWATFYIAGSEQSGYKEFVDSTIETLLDDFVYLDKSFIKRKIEEMEPLEEIIEKAIEENNKISIIFLYSAYDRETFTSIKEYIAKCSNLQNYDLDMQISESPIIDGEGEEKKITRVELSRFSMMYNMKKSLNILSSYIPSKKANELYDESHEPTKETIYFIGNNDIEEALLDTKVIGIDKDEEEYALVRFKNQTFKYKVEFREEFTIDKEMNNIIFFVDIDDTSEIESIFNEINENGINNFLFLVHSNEDIPKDEEKTKIESLKEKFEKISSKIELFNISEEIDFNEDSNMFELRHDEISYRSFERMFVHLTTGEEQYEEREEKGCCRV